VTQKLGQISKIRPDQIKILCHSLRIRDQLPAPIDSPIVNGGAVEDGRMYNFERFMTLTLIRSHCHTVVHHSSTYTCMPNFIEIKETFCGRTDISTHVCMDGWTFESGFIRSTLSKPVLVAN